MMLDSPSPHSSTHPLTPISDGSIDQSPARIAQTGAPIPMTRMPSASAGISRPTRSAQPGMLATTWSQMAELS